MSKSQDKVRVALVGYGVMGQLIERLAPGHNCEITAVFDENRPLNSDVDANFDVAIDFSLPHAVAGTVKHVAKLGKSIVIGTTGWDAQRDEVLGLVKQAGIGCVVGSNFSIGMNMFFAMVRHAAALASRYDEYDVMLHEFHHRRKADSPSGTALELANIVLREHGGKQRVLTDRSDGVIDVADLHVSSTRGGDIPGTHMFVIDSPADSIELTHRARNREGFAHGALRAACWLNGKPGFYDFSDIFPQL